MNFLKPTHLEQSLLYLIFRKLETLRLINELLEICELMSTQSYLLCKLFEKLYLSIVVFAESFRLTDRQIKISIYQFIKPA